MELLENDQPELLIVSPPCTKFGSLQNLNKRPIPEDQMQEAREMVEHGVRMCQKQIKLGKAFIFEHPANARSWKMRCLRELSGTEGVEEFVLNLANLG